MDGQSRAAVDRLRGPAVIEDRSVPGPASVVLFPDEGPGEDASPSKGMRPSRPKIVHRPIVAWVTTLVLAIVVGALGAFNLSQAGKLSNAKVAVADRSAQLSAATRSNNAQTARIQGLTSEDRSLAASLGQCQSALRLDEQFVRYSQEAWAAAQAGNVPAARSALRQAASVGQKIDSSDSVGVCLAQRGSTGPSVTSE
jgi:hypothetical protein